MFHPNIEFLRLDAFLETLKESLNAIEIGHGCSKRRHNGLGACVGDGNIILAARSTTTGATIRTHHTGRWGVHAKRLLSGVPCGDDSDRRTESDRGDETRGTGASDGVGKVPGNSDGAVGINGDLTRRLQHRSVVLDDVVRFVHIVFHSIMV